MGNNNFNLFDIARWIFSLLFIPVLLWVIFYTLSYPFEFFNIYLTRAPRFLHIISWLCIGAILFPLTKIVTSFIPMLSTFFVRQRFYYIILLNITLFCYLIILLYVVWSDNYVLNWELLKYSTTNRVLFTIFSISQVFYIANLINASLTENDIDNI
mgnify:CR=1 FL=1